MANVLREVGVIFSARSDESTRDRYAADCYLVYNSTPVPGFVFLPENPDEPSASLRLLIEEKKMTTDS